MLSGKRRAVQEEGLARACAQADPRPASPLPRGGPGAVCRPAGPLPHHPPRLQQSDPSMHWKWVGSTSLLCYGQMATHAGAQVLPWVDNIVSRMVYYYSCSSYVSPAASPPAPRSVLGTPGGCQLPQRGPSTPLCTHRTTL